MFQNLRLTILKDLKNLSNNQILHFSSKLFESESVIMTMIECVGPVPSIHSPTPEVEASDWNAEKQWLAGGAKEHTWAFIRLHGDMG